MAIGPWQILIVVILILLLFGGRGKISSIMGDMGKGITSFKKGLKDGMDEETRVDSAIDVTPPKAAAKDTKKS